MAIRRLSLDFSDWPDLHRAAYDAARQRGALFRPGGKAARWAPATDRGVRQRWGAWLHYLTRKDGHRVSETPADTVTLENLLGFVEDMQSRNLSSVTLATTVRDVGEALRVMDPAADLTLVHQAANELADMAEPAFDFISPKVGPSDLYDAGLDRMERLQRDAYSHWRPALEFGDGLMMAVWPCKPVRLRTFALTCVGTNLVRAGDGTYDLRYVALDNKTKVQIKAALPTELTLWIDLWLDIQHSVLHRGQEPLSALWVNRRGTRISDRQLYCRFSAATLDELDVRINPQRVRRIVATGIAVEASENVELIPDVLDHANPETARDHYIKANKLGHSRHYLSLLKDRRKRIANAAQQRR